MIKVEELICAINGLVGVIDKYEAQVKSLQEELNRVQTLNVEALEFYKKLSDTNQQLIKVSELLELKDKADKWDKQIGHATNLLTIDVIRDFILHRLNLEYGDDWELHSGTIDEFTKNYHKLEAQVMILKAYAEEIEKNPVKGTW